MMTKIRKRVVSGILAAVTLFAAIRPEIPLFASQPKNTQTFTYSDENITIEAEIGKSTVFTAGEDVYITDITVSGSALQTDETVSGSAVTAETKPRTVSISKDDVASGGALAVTEEKTYNIDDVELYVEVLDESDERFADIELEEGQEIKYLDIGFKTQDGEIVKADLQNAKISYTINTPEEAESVDDVQVFKLTDTEQPTATITEDSETVVEEITDIETKEKDNTVTFETDSLAPIAVVYTVDFYFGNYEYHLGGGESILLSRLFGLLGIEEDVSNVTDVTFSNPDLVKVERVGFNWFLTSLQAFDTEELLTVTFKNGEVVEIRVTDATGDVKYKLVTLGSKTSYDTDSMLTDSKGASKVELNRTTDDSSDIKGATVNVIGSNWRFYFWYDGNKIVSLNNNFVPSSTQIAASPQNTFSAYCYSNSNRKYVAYITNANNVGTIKCGNTDVTNNYNVNSNDVAQAEAKTGYDFGYITVDGVRQDGYSYDISTLNAQSDLHTFKAYFKPTSTNEYNINYKTAIVDGNDVTLYGTSCTAGSIGSIDSVLISASDGICLNPDTLELKSNISVSTDAAATGYSFVGWFKVEEGTTFASASDILKSSKATGNTSASLNIIDKKIYTSGWSGADLIAVYAKDVKITYKAEQDGKGAINVLTGNTGGTYEGSASNIVETVKIPQSTVAYAPKSVTIESNYHKAFYGWYDSEGKLVSEDVNFVPSGEQIYDGAVYTAKFVPTYTIIYNKRSLTGSYTGTLTSSSETVAAGGTANGSIATANSESYFAYWADSEGNIVSTDKSGVFVPAGGQIKDTTYYAYFNDETAILAVNDTSLADIFNNNTTTPTRLGRAGISNGHYYVADKENKSALSSNLIELVRWEKNGENFVGNKTAGRDHVYVDSGLGVVAGDVIMAIVKPKGTFIVKYDAEAGGTISNTKDYAGSDDAKGCIAAANSNRRFLGWQIDGKPIPVSGETITAEDLKNLISKGYIKEDDTVIKATFGTGFKITYQQQFDEETPTDFQTENYISGDPLGCEVDKLSGYSFIGWYSSDGETLITDNYKITKEDIVTADSDLTFIAKYITAATITAYSNNEELGTVSAANLTLDRYNKLDNPSELTATVVPKDSDYIEFKYWEVVDGGYYMTDSETKEYIKDNIESAMIDSSYIFKDGTILRAVFAQKQNVLKIIYEVEWNEKDNPSYPIHLRIYGTGKENNTATYFTGSTSSLKLDEAKAAGYPVPENPPSVYEYVAYSFNSDNSIKFERYNGCQADSETAGDYTYIISCWSGAGEVIIEEIEHFIPSTYLLASAVKADKTGSPQITFYADGRRNQNRYILPEQPINGEIKVEGINRGSYSSDAAFKEDTYSAKFLINKSYVDSNKKQTVRTELPYYHAEPKEGYKFYAWEYNGELLTKDKIAAKAGELAKFYEDYTANAGNYGKQYGQYESVTDGDYTHVWEYIGEYFLVDSPNLVNILKAHFVPAKPYATINYSVSPDLTYCYDDTVTDPREVLVEGSTTRKALEISSSLAHYSLSDEVIADPKNEKINGDISSTATALSNKWTFYFWRNVDTGEIVSYDRTFDPDRDALIKDYKALEPQYLDAINADVAERKAEIELSYKAKYDALEETYENRTETQEYTDAKKAIDDAKAAEIADMIEEVSELHADDLQDELIYNYEAVFGTRYDFPLEYVPKTPSALTNDDVAVTEGVNSTVKTQDYTEYVDSETEATGSKALVDDTTDHHKFYQWTVRRRTTVKDDEDNVISTKIEDYPVSTDASFIPRIDLLRNIVFGETTDPLNDRITYDFVDDNGVSYSHYRTVTTKTDAEGKEYDVVGLRDPVTLEPVKIKFTAHYIHIDNLTIAKNVSGNVGSKDKYFKMNIALKGLESNTKYIVDMTNADFEIEANPNDATSCISEKFIFPHDEKTNPNGTKYNEYYIETDSQGNAEQEFYLRHGQYIVIKGLPDDANETDETKYEVIEEAEDYKSEYAITGETSGFNSYSENEETGVITIKKNGNEHITVTFTNTRSSVLPTGVGTTSILLIISTILGIYGIVFLQIKKKNTVCY